jgi:hypothetical protein
MRDEWQTTASLNKPFDSWDGGSSGCQTQLAPTVQCQRVSPVKTHSLLLHVLPLLPPPPLQSKMPPPLLLLLLRLLAGMTTCLCQASTTPPSATTC